MSPLIHRIMSNNLKNIMSKESCDVKLALHFVCNHTILLSLQDSYALMLLNHVSLMVILKKFIRMKLLRSVHKEKNSCDMCKQKLKRLKMNKSLIFWTVLLKM